MSIDLALSYQKTKQFIIDHHFAIFVVYSFILIMLMFKALVCYILSFNMTNITLASFLSETGYLVLYELGYLILLCAGLLGEANIYYSSISKEDDYD